jgi:hypothetical protein
VDSHGLSQSKLGGRGGDLAAVNMNPAAFDQRLQMAAGELRRVPHERLVQAQGVVERIDDPLTPVVGLLQGGVPIIVA